MQNPPERVCRGCGSLVHIEDTRCLECDMVRPPKGWKHVSDTHDAFLGRVIGERYLLSRHLGSGASAAVYRAESLQIPRRFAVKIIRLEDEYARIRFDREIAALAKLRNPHVVSIYEVVDISDSLIAVVMDLIEGVTLQQYVETRGAMPYAEVIRLARQIANGVYEAHGLGLIHRDIKPENLMVERLPSGQKFMRLLDFGIVWTKGATHMTQGFVGTPLFCSPEQALGGEVDERSDIYSMGAVLFYMLSGHPPFEASNTMRLLHDHVTKRAPSLFETEHGRCVPEELEALVASMLAKDPLERPATMADVVFQLERIPVSTSVAESLDELTKACCGSCGAAELARHSRRPGSDVLCMVSVPMLAPSSEWAHFVASATQSRLAVVDGENALRWFSLVLRREQGSAVQLDAPVTSITMSSTRVWLGLASGDVVAVDETGAITLIKAFGRRVTHIAVGYHEERAVVALDDGRVEVLAIDGIWNTYRLGDVNALAMSRAGDLAAVAQGELITIRPTTFFGRPNVTIHERDGVASLAFSHDGYLLAMATESGQVHLENPDTGAELLDFGDLHHNVRQVAFSPSNILMALCTDTTRAYILDLQCAHAPECTIDHLLCHRFGNKRPNS